MSALALSWDNVLDQATVFARTEDVPELPRANLQDSRLETVWRHNSTSARAEFELASATPITLAAVLAHNLSPGNTEAGLASYSSYSTGSQSGTLVDAEVVDSPPAVNPANYYAYWPDATTPAAWVVYEAAQTGLALKRAGRVWAGPSVEIPDCLYEPEYDDTGAARFSKRGAGFQSFAQSYRRLTINTHLDAATVYGSGGTFNDGSNLAEQLRELYAGSEFIALPAADFAGDINAGFFRQRTGIYGHLAGRPEISGLDVGRYRVRIQIEGLG